MLIEDLKIDQVLENKEIAETFLCSNQGGIRKSKKTKTIVLLAKFDDCSYKHRKEGDILYFTGMGKKGDQEMKRQNKSLLNAKEEGFTLHLFELYEAKKTSALAVNPSAKIPSYISMGERLKNEIKQNKVMSALVKDMNITIMDDTNVSMNMIDLNKSLGKLDKIPEIKGK